MSDVTFAVKQFSTAQDRLCKAAYQQFKNHGYSAGYFQSVACQMFELLSSEDQDRFVRQLTEAADRAERLTGI